MDLDLEDLTVTQLSRLCVYQRVMQAATPPRPVSVPPSPSSSCPPMPGVGQVVYPSPQPPPLPSFVSVPQSQSSQRMPGSQGKRGMYGIVILTYVTITMWSTLSMHPHRMHQIRWSDGPVASASVCVSCRCAVPKLLNRSIYWLGWYSWDQRNIVIDCGRHSPMTRRKGFDVAFAKLLWSLVLVLKDLSLLTLVWLL